MSTRLSVLAIAALVLALLVTPTWASASSMRWGISGFGGYQTYSMSDVNDFTAEVNDSAAANGLTGSLEDVKHGVGFGGGFRGMNEKCIFSLDYVRLNASTSADFSDGSGNTVNAEFKVPANGVTVGAAYLFPSSHKARFGLGAGIGYYASDAKVTVGGASAFNDVKGHGVGFHGMGLMDSPLSNAVHVELAAGYRYAKTSNLEIDGQEALNPDGSKAKIDWSGLMTQLGLTFYFGQK